MYKSDILHSLNKYYNDNKQLVFYKKCIDYITDLKIDFIDKITNDEHFLESIRITILMNPNKYHIYLYDKKKKNTTNYTIKLNDEMKDKLLTQLICITKYNNLLDIVNVELDDIKIKFEKKYDFNYINIIVSDKKIDFKDEYYELKNYYEITGYIFGVDIFNLLKYQRLDRLIDFIQCDNKEATNVMEMLNRYIIFLQKQDWQVKDRIMVFSGVVFTALGLTYTRDIDLLILSEKSNDAVKDMDLIKCSNCDTEPHVLLEDNNWYKESNNQIISYKYQKNWLTYTMPNLVGAEDIFETVSNPKYYFIFMGIKFVSVDMNIKRFLSRVNPCSIADLIMFKKYNNYDFNNDLCIPNMTIRQGKLNVFNQDTIKQLQYTVKSKIKEFYNYDISIDEVIEILQKCNVNAFDIYKGKNTYDPDTSLIKKFHLDVKSQIFYKYCYNAEYLLDIGSGQLTDSKFWNKVNIKHVIGIEPSISSIKNGLARLEKYKIKTDVKLINGIGDLDWHKHDKYNAVFGNKYDVITFQFTIHYMIPNIDIIIKNIKAVSKQNTKIIITCMDGKKIYDNIMKYSKIEVRNEQEPIFAIVPTNKYKNIPINNINVLVYFKGAYGVASGSIEPLVDIDELINKFSKNGIELLEKKDFLQYNSKNKNNMSKIQKNVSYYYTSLIFNYT